MKKYAIIAAGGSGQRMGANIPKQFLVLQGKPILWHTVNAFVTAFGDIQVVLVVPAEHLAKAKDICAGFRKIQFVEGGSTRFESVRNGLRLVREPSIVFVHDAVRCLASVQLLQRCYEQAVEKGSAIPAVPVSDSLRFIEGGKHQPIDRNRIRSIQTPQVFRSEIILPAFEYPETESFTDEATVVEAGGHAVELIEGEISNIKITTPADLAVAEVILSKR